MFEYSNASIYEAALVRKVIIGCEVFNKGVF